MSQILQRRLFVSETVSDTIIPLVSKQLEKIYIVDNIDTFSHEVLKSINDENVNKYKNKFNKTIITDLNPALLESFGKFLKENYKYLCEVDEKEKDKMGNNAYGLYKPDINVNYTDPNKQVDNIPTTVKAKIPNEFFRNVNTDISMPTVISMNMDIGGNEIPVIIGTKVFVQKIPSIVASDFSNSFINGSAVYITKVLVNLLSQFSSSLKINKYIQKMISMLFDKSESDVLLMTSSELKTKQRFCIFLNSLEINDYNLFNKKIYSMSKVDRKYLNSVGLDMIVIDESQKKSVIFHTINSSDVESKIMTYDQLGKVFNYEIKDLETLEKTTRIFMN